METAGFVGSHHVQPAAAVPAAPAAAASTAAIAAASAAAPAVPTAGPTAHDRQQGAPPAAATAAAPDSPGDQPHLPPQRLCAAESFASAAVTRPLGSPCWALLPSGSPSTPLSSTFQGGPPRNRPGPPPLRPPIARILLLRRCLWKTSQTPQRGLKKLQRPGQAHQKSLTCPPSQTKNLPSAQMTSLRRNALQHLSLSLVKPLSHQLKSQRAQRSPQRRGPQGSCRQRSSCRPG